MESTTDVLRARAAVHESLARTYLVSLGGHVLLVGVLLFFPTGFFSGTETEIMADVMTVSLGGSMGPSQGGETALAAQPVQDLIPVEEADQDVWVQPPAPAPPEETITVRDAPRLPERDIPVESAPEEARGRTPTKGPELRQGTALADTGARGLGTGLSAGGLGFGGELDVGDFCCPEYLSVMSNLIRQRWNDQQQQPGAVVMKFTVQRDGTLTDIVRQNGSGYLALDMSAERALLTTGQVPPLPSKFTGDRLPVNLTFEYR
jgi:TonB family protein